MPTTRCQASAAARVAAPNQYAPRHTLATVAHRQSRATEAAADLQRINACYRRHVRKSISGDASRSHAVTACASSTTSASASSLVASSAAPREYSDRSGSGLCHGCLFWPFDPTNVRGCEIMIATRNIAIEDRRKGQWRSDLVVEIHWHPEPTPSARSRAVQPNPRRCGHYLDRAGALKRE
jgi:hypothetical protein